MNMHGEVEAYLHAFLPQYPLYRRLSEPQSRSGSCGEHTNLLLLPVIELRFLGRLARSLVDIQTGLPQFIHSNISPRICNYVYDLSPHKHSYA
jgi:hypothetical protein